MSIEKFENPKKILIRRDSKDSCYSEEMSEDLSVTNIDDGCRLSPFATLSPISRKSSGGDSGVDYDVMSEGELSRENSFKKNFSPSKETAPQNSELVMDKLSLLEQKLKQMETHLIQEMEKRQILERKVTRLEEENERLSSLRTTAATQLQAFSEKFFAMPEPPKGSSPVGTPPQFQSPRNSQLDLRRIASNSSVTSRTSSQSLKSFKSRYSNISL